MYVGGISSSVHDVTGSSTSESLNSDLFVAVVVEFSQFCKTLNIH